MQGVGITDCDLGAAEAKLLDWLARGLHGEMDYMAKHGTKRNRPAESVPGTVRIISARMDYLPPTAGKSGRRPSRLLSRAMRWAGTITR